MAKLVLDKPRPKVLHKEYASFRPKVVEYFVSEVLPKSRVLCDPMAGTSPLIPYISYQGVTAHFNDILPLHACINAAKTYQTYRALRKGKDDWVKFASKELSHRLRRLRRKRLLVSDMWMHDDTVEGLLYAWGKADEHEPLIRGFLKAVIILCVRPLSTASAAPTNTTWYRPGGVSSEKDIRDIIVEKVSKLKSYYEYYYEPGEGIRGGRCYFSTQDARTIQLKGKRQVDTIVTSPPYANRYDYTTMYAPELYFLWKAGLKVELAELKQRVLASNVVKDYVDPEEDLATLASKAPKTARFLRDVDEKGKETSRYYLRYFAKYYANLYAVLDHLLTILQRNGRLYVVVQSNVHRGELNRMEDFVIDYGLRKGLKPDVVHRHLHPHQGRRNISADYPLVLKKHSESIIRLEK